MRLQYLLSFCIPLMFQTLEGAVESNPPKYLYKILSVTDWQTTKESEMVALPAEDTAFIHFSQEDQLERITSKYWADKSEYLILQIDPSKLVGELVYETNPGGSAKYYHLYQGSIPKNAIVESRLVRGPYIIGEKPAQMIVGILCRTSNDPDRGPEDIPAHWGRFFSENIAAQIPNKISDDVVALYCDYESDYTGPYSLVIGCPVDSLAVIPEGMVGRTMPAGAYATFRAVGEYPKTLIDTWVTIWGTPLERTYTGDYELYGEKFANSPQEVDVVIAVKQPALLETPAAGVLCES